jgi:uncharacterized protein DUF4062
MIFLSHTSELCGSPEGGSFVAAARAAVMRAGHAITNMAYFAACDEEPAGLCRRMVSAADVYVGIIGLRYGTSLPGRPEVSFTELEFETATQLGLPRLIFLLRDDGAPPPRSRSTLRDRDRQKAFRSRLQEAGVTVAWIDSPTEFEIGLYQALVELAATKRMRRLSV